MRLLVVQPGASYAIEDVYRGFVWGLKQNGHEVRSYNLDQRVEFSTWWLSRLAEYNESLGRPVPQLSDADVHYHAGTGVLERALSAEPEIEWVIIVSGMYILPAWLKLLKRAGRKVGILFTESPYNDFDQAELMKYADVVWTHERLSLERLKTYAIAHGAGHVPVHYVPHAYNPTAHFPMASEKSGHDVLYVGTGFPCRVDFFESAPWGEIDFGLYGTWTNVKPESKLSRHVRSGPIDNKETVELYRKCKVGLNLHRTSVDFYVWDERIKDAYSLNPRAYELAACGLFHVSDYRPELGEVFGDLVPTYRNPTECVDLIKEWLSRSERERAERGMAMAEAVKAHTWDVRAEQIVGEISKVGAAQRSVEAGAYISGDGGGRRLKVGG